MKKALFAGSVLLVLSGCQLTGDMGNNNLASNDFSAMSCDEIKATFDNHNARMESLNTGNTLLSSMGVNTGAGSAQAAVDKAYLQAKEVAQPIAIAKGCTYTL
ncbi:hypothetical protein [Oceanisphaera sediminis]|uniref:Lipoprotein n=1 Tax=Oceanisphaera sediminis TaxID=981381 RepID=A0ABP7EGU3_9GAMM|nr:hypothetical protein [uncultured Oceanisphaera sp.]